MLIVCGAFLSPFVRASLLWLVLTLLFLIAATIAFRLLTMRTAVEGHPPKSFLPAVAALPTAPRESLPPIPPLERVRSLDWFRFEKLMAALFKECGFAVEHFGGANPDGGIDLIISLDGKAGGVQCKHWKAWKIGVKEIREFVGALKDRGLERGIFVTLQSYTSEARALAARHQIELVGELEISRMLAAARCEQNPLLLSILHDSRKTCPKCEAGMVLRTAGSGKSKGRQFWGCSTFPRCRGTLPHAD